MFQNLKTFFKYHRSERNGAIALLIIMVLISVGMEIYTRLYTPPIQDSSHFLSELDSIRNAHIEAQSIEKVAGPRSKRTSEADRFLFDPNHLSDSGYMALGFSEKEIQTLRNYMKSGASFRVKKDFAKLYFVSDSDYVALEPYIDLPEDYPKRKSVKEKYEPYGKYSEKKFTRDTTTWSDTADFKNYSYKKFTCDLNHADTTELKRLPYIGSYYAKKIVEMRKELGGFYDLSQLLELYKMTPETIDKFASQITVDKSAIRTITVNSCTAQDLAAHPYISFKLANAIILKRESTGGFTDMDNLCETGLLNADLCTKLAPYLEF